MLRISHLLQIRQLHSLAVNRPFYVIPKMHNRLEIQGLWMKIHCCIPGNILKQYIPCDMVHYYAGNVHLSVNNL